MDIIDRLDDEVNKLEYDVMLPALPQSLNDLIESAKNEPQASSGIANAPVVIDADFGTGGMDSIEDIVNAIDLLADDMIDTLGLVGNTLVTGFAEDARKSKRTNELLQSINRVLTEQWEREQKDRALGIKNKMADDSDSDSSSTGLTPFGTGAGSSDDDIFLGGNPFGGKDKDKNKDKDSGKDKNKNKSKGKFGKVLDSIKRNPKLKWIVGGLSALTYTEAAGISNVTGIFDDSDEAMQPEPVAGNSEDGMLSPSDTSSLTDIATSNVTNNGALTVDGNKFSEQTYLQNKYLTQPKVVEKVSEARKGYYSDLVEDSAKLNSELSTLKTFSAINSPKISEDMPLIPDMGMSAFAATAMLGAPLLLNRPPVERMPSMSAYRDALPNRNLPIQSQPKIPPPVHADTVKPANPSKIPKAGPKMRIPKIGVGGALGAMTAGMDIFSTATSDDLSGRDKTEDIAGSLGTIGAYMIPGIGQAMGLADLATTGINLAFDTEIPSLGGLIGDGVSDLTSGAFDLADMVMGNDIEPRAEGDERFYDNMTIASALGPLGMLADATGLTDYLTDTFFGSDAPDAKKPEVETTSNNAPSKAVTDATPTTAPAPTTKADSPYIKTLSKALPFYAKVHGKDPSIVGDVLKIYKIPSTSQGMANAMAKDYLGEDFSSEIAIEEYNQAMASIDNADAVNVESNVDTLAGDVKASGDVNTSGDITTSGSSLSTSGLNPLGISDQNNIQSFDSMLASMSNDSLETQNAIEEIQRESYDTIAPKPEVIVNLDRAADVKQTSPAPIKPKEKTKVVTKTKVVQPPLSLGNIASLDSISGINHLNKSIG